MRVVLFVIVTNALLLGALFLFEQITGVLGANYLSDYFFFSLIIQWILGTFLMISGPSHNTHLKHSPNQATRMAASLLHNRGKDSQNNQTKADDMRLSHKWFISGAFCLLMCVVL
ncbi:hypothetical protein RJ45_05120 [Photobacterium gaetbulicola]|uniref:Uncharacterized protein n=1 Tax=Photobacterium gaetbulicola TaxID=1295392 RepID=A0A0B9GIY0_9GAMM|nr:hypothetical protein [Photobacterium gaetbulicola]KHT64690.1 hypothetical protein RJ45_05120 [Photobacterium gaetbulicola]